MSKDVLKASKRTETGASSVKKLRHESFIPGVLYGHHIDNVNIKVHDQDFDKFFRLHGTGASLYLDIDGEKTFVLFKEVQLNRMKNETTHVEFQALSAGEKIKVKVPIHFIGNETIPAGIIFQGLHHEIEMSVLPKDIIEEIIVDVSKAKLGEHAYLRDLDVYKNEAFDISDDESIMLYTISEPSFHLDEDEETEEQTAEVPEIGKEAE